MGSIKKAYFDAPEGQVHYRYIISSQKDKKQPCIFLHMSATSSAHYEKMMKLYAIRGHDCYAPDMPGFGNSFDPEFQPPDTGYYIDIFLSLFKSLSLHSFHILGHHSGAGLAIEMAALHDSFVLSVCLVGAAIMPSDEQAALNAKLNTPFNRPVADGSHLLKQWQYMQRNGITDVDYCHQETLDHLRAWKGRIQIYTCVFKQDVCSLFEKIKIPVVSMCARDDILWPYVTYISQIKPDAPQIEVAGGNFETGNPHSCHIVAKHHFDFLDGLETRS